MVAKGDNAGRISFLTMPSLNRITIFPLQVRRKPRAAGGSSKEGPIRRPVPHGPKMRPGDPVHESGIYEVVQGDDHRQAHEVVMLRGTEFPLCDTCGDQVRFRLIRTAPYIFQDEDFEEQD